MYVRIDVSPDRPDDILDERMVVGVSVMHATVTSELCNIIARHPYREDILAEAAELIEDFDEYPVEEDDMHDEDFYIAHWTLLNLYEAGVLRKDDYERFEMEVEEAKFADILRCLNGLNCDCR